jgi:uncharacterized protein with NRDE domain
MCLIAIAWRASSRFPLIVAANRDEAHSRPTAAAHWWPDAPRVLAGRDRSAGGTWLGIDRSGRFAAVTNLRESTLRAGAWSRGALVADFLCGGDSAQRYATRVAADASSYGPFNLLVADGASLWFVGSRAAPRELGDGVHAVSNVEPSVDWPKVAMARDRVAAVLESPSPRDALFALLAERSPARDGYDERQVSPFQLDAVWGTRSSTVVLADAAGRTAFVERSFDPAGVCTGEVREVFERTSGL